MEDTQKETEQEKWERFRKDCPKLKDGICWTRDMLACEKRGYKNCDLWYAINFK